MTVYVEFSGFMQVKLNQMCNETLCNFQIYFLYLWHFKICACHESLKSHLGVKTCPDRARLTRVHAACSAYPRSPAATSVLNVLPSFTVGKRKSWWWLKWWRIESIQSEQSISESFRITFHYTVSFMYREHFIAKKFLKWFFPLTKLMFYPRDRPSVFDWWSPRTLTEPLIEGAKSLV